MTATYYLPGVTIDLEADEESWCWLDEGDPFNVAMDMQYQEIRELREQVALLKLAKHGYLNRIHAMRAEIARLQGAEWEDFDGPYDPEYPYPN